LVKDSQTSGRAIVQQTQSRSRLTVREFERTLLAANAILHCRGCFQTVLIVDYSRAGLQLARTFGLFKHDTVQVELTSGVSLPGRVAWSVGNRSGVTFSDPMDADHPALVELAYKAGKALGETAISMSNARQRKATERPSGI
jgi:hypothetical protein